MDCIIMHEYAYVKYIYAIFENFYIVGGIDAKQPINSVKMHILP